MQRVILFTLVGCLVLMVQACVTQIKPVLKADPDIDATIARHQKQLDSGIATGGFKPAQARSLQESLDKIKQNYSALKERGKPTKAEIKEINKMLAQFGERLFSSRPTPKRPAKKKGSEKGPVEVVPD